MKVGDLVWITGKSDPNQCGVGVYLGSGWRGKGFAKRTKYIYKFLWKGRIATFDKPFWHFEVIEEINGI